VTPNSKTSRSVCMAATDMSVLIFRKKVGGLVLGIGCSIWPLGCGDSDEVLAVAETKTDAAADDGAETSANEQLKPDAGLVASDASATLADAGPGEFDAGRDAGPWQSGDASIDSGICSASASGTARHAFSGGFTGTEADYFALYDEPCNSVTDCSDACELAGGTTEACSYSECVEPLGDEPRLCLPPPVWRNLGNIEFEGETALDGVELTLVSIDYHDMLFTDRFELEVPDDAVVRGLSVDIRHAGGSSIADDAVQLHVGGEVRSANRSSPQLWAQDLEWVSYGGADDLWGGTWQATVLNDPIFGVGLSVLFTENSGNTRAYVDQVRLTVHYDGPCEP
jgi:hypothetical protein